MFVFFSFCAALIVIDLMWSLGTLPDGMSILKWFFDRLIYLVYIG